MVGGFGLRREILGFRIYRERERETGFDSIDPTLERKVPFYCESEIWVGDKRPETGGEGPPSLFLRGGSPGGYSENLKIVRWVRISVIRCEFLL